MAEILHAGTRAPDVMFRVGRDEMRLLDYNGEKNVVLAFYASAFTGG